MGIWTPPWSRLVPVRLPHWDSVWNGMTRSSPSNLKHTGLYRQRSVLPFSAQNTKPSFQNPIILQNSYIISHCILASFLHFPFFLCPQVFKGKDSPLTLDWDRVRVFDRDVGQMFVNMAKTAKEAKVCICIAVVMIV